MERCWRSPPEREALFLAQHRVEPLGSLSMNPGSARPCSLGHLFRRRRAFAADANIVRNRVVEKDHVLKTMETCARATMRTRRCPFLEQRIPAAVRLPEFRRQLGAGRLPELLGPTSAVLLPRARRSYAGALLRRCTPNRRPEGLRSGHTRRGGPLCLLFVHDRLDPGCLGRQVEKVRQLGHKGENGPVDAGDDEQEHEQNHEVHAAGRREAPP